MIIVVPSCLKDADGARTRLDQNESLLTPLLSPSMTIAHGPICSYMAVIVCTARKFGFSNVPSYTAVHAKALTLNRYRHGQYRIQDEFYI